MFAFTIEEARNDALRLLQAIQEVIPTGQSGSMISLDLLRETLGRVSEFSENWVRNRFIPRKVNVTVEDVVQVLDSPEMFVSVESVGEGKVRYIKDGSGERIEIGQDFLEQECSHPLLVGILVEEAFHARDFDDACRGEVSRCYREFRAKLFQLYVLFRWLDEDSDPRLRLEIEEAIRTCIKEYMGWFYEYTKDE